MNFIAKRLRRRASGPGAVLSVFALAIAAGAAPARAADGDEPGARAARAEAQTAQDFVQLGAGIDYSRGDYGDSADTSVAAIPLSIKYVHRALTLRVSLPYARVTGPGTLVSTTDGSPGGAGTGGTPGPAMRRTEGFADMFVALSYAFDLVPDSLLFDLTGKVKIPTGSVRKELGTGQADFIAAGTLTKVLGPVNIYVEGRHRFSGRSAAFPARNTWGASAGAAIRAGRRMTLALDYDWQQSAFRGNVAASELTGSATLRLSPSWRLQAYATAGFSTNSVDHGAGLQILYRFGR